ncbi:MAG: hypothetical protein ACK5AZ_18975 [Bryobacteraceae bacterium]
MTAIDFTKALELAIKGTQHPFPRLTRIRAKADPKHHFHLAASELTEPTFFLIDVTLADSEVRLIEANGSNGALSSTSAPGDRLRAIHMGFAFESKVRPPGPGVALLCHQAGFLHLAEFFARAEFFRAELSRRHDAALRGTGEALGDEDVAIVCGSTADVAAILQRRDTRLFYMGRPVTFISNANLLPELARRGVIGYTDGGYDVDLGVFHEGSSTPLIHDKALQQELTDGTGIRPLAWRLAHDREEWTDAIVWFRQREMPCVAKMHAGSGGAGIELITPEMTDAECANALDRLLDSARKTYGANVEATAFPIALFEFAEADPVDVEGAPHLWDIRVMALVFPGGVDCHACVARLCPAPFDGSWSRETWVSNLTGRDGGQAERFLRSPGELGLTESDLRRILECCAEWSVAASRWGTDQRVRRESGS